MSTSGVIQFDRNADFPIDDVARDPTPFPNADIDPCARITTRVYNPRRNQVATVQNVLVRTLNPIAATGGGGMGGGVGGGFSAARGTGGDDDDSLSTSSSDDDSDTDMDEDEDEGGGGKGGTSVVSDSSAGGQASPSMRVPQRAYWLQRTLRDAIYGRVKFAVVLRRRPPGAALPMGSGGGSNVEWEVTEEKCAVKEMSWQHIRRERGHLAEDPIKEVEAMQFLKRWHEQNTPPTMDGGGIVGLMNVPINQTMMATNIMMPVDVLSDDRYLYSVMPYCDGGELFDRLELSDKFSEDEARYWMHQILNGVENLQKAGICHRDMSLENLLVHNGSCLIIDMGMCLRIPYEDDAGNATGGTTFSSPPAHMLSGGSSSGANTTNSSANENGGITASIRSMADMSIDGGTSNTQTPQQIQLQQQQQQQQQQPNIIPTLSTPTTTGGPRRRYLIKPQGTCGKWNYMSPEIAKNREPFDGLAVDMWAVGVILFLMLTGFPAWERPCSTDERFKYMTAGYLVQMLTEWEIGLSPDAMDLLQRMLWLDPRDRLSLDQVRAHPWMLSGRRDPPPGGVMGGMGDDPRLQIGGLRG